jgi:hypothetical protein
MFASERYDKHIKGKSFILGVSRMKLRFRLSRLLTLSAVFALCLLAAPLAMASASPPDDVLVNGDVADAVINLSRETIALPSGFSVAAYSTNGGAKWVVGALPKGDRWNKLFDKGLSLCLTNKFDHKTKQPADNAQQITFPTINKRPKGNPDKLVPNYLIHADPTGRTNGAWTLSQKSTKNNIVMTPSIEGYEMCVSDASGKKPNGKWSPLPENGTLVEAAVKGQKKLYFVRSIATDAGGYTPASSIFKVKPATLQKPTKYKVNYKKETVKLKKGDFIYTGKLEPGVADFEIKSLDEEETELWLILYNIQNTGDSSWETVFTKPTAYVGLGKKAVTVFLEDYLDEEITYLTFWKPATFNKPASEKQVNKLAPRWGDFYDIVPKKSGNKLLLPAGLEFGTYRESTDTFSWGKNIKLGYEEDFYMAEIRKASTAKGTGGDDTAGGAKAASFHGYIDGDVIIKESTSERESERENDKGDKIIRVDNPIIYGGSIPTLPVLVRQFNLQGYTGAGTESNPLVKKGMGFNTSGMYIKGCLVGKYEQISSSSTVRNLSISFNNISASFETYNAEFIFRITFHKINGTEDLYFRFQSPINAHENILMAFQKMYPKATGSGSAENDPFKLSDSWISLFSLSGAHLTAANNDYYYARSGSSSIDLKKSGVFPVVFEDRITATSAPYPTTEFYLDVTLRR